MTGQEQAERTAANVLELVQALRQIAAVRALHTGPHTCRHDVYDLDRFYLADEDCPTLQALDNPSPAPTSSDPREVPA